MNHSRGTISFHRLFSAQEIGFGANAGHFTTAVIRQFLRIGKAVAAIPAVMMFSYFTTKIKTFDIEMDNSSSELVDYFMKRTVVTRR